MRRDRAEKKIHAERTLAKTKETMCPLSNPISKPLLEIRSDVVASTTLFCIFFWDNFVLKIFVGALGNKIWFELQTMLQKPN